MLEDRLMRTRLLFGEEKLKKLQSACVSVVGCGAVGSFAIEALARSGIGHLKLIDFDSVAISNINRQLFALQSTLGQKKIDVAQKRIQEISCDIQVDVFDAFLDNQNAENLLKETDFVIDAIDSCLSKIALYKVCQQKHIPFISSMGAGFKTDPLQIHFATLKKTTVCPLASKLRKLCQKENISMDFPVVYSQQKPLTISTENKQIGSFVPITGIFGLMLANFVILELIK